MFTCKYRVIFTTFIFALCLAPSVHAQMAVVDIRSITQLVRQIQVLQDQLNVARNQLTQAQRQLQSMSGGRGMERLLAGTVRNYLPPDWAELEAVIRGGGGYSAMSAEMQAILTRNAVLTPAQIGRLSIDEREQLAASRNSAALLQVLTRQALSATSNRFDSIQQLINAIPSAPDQKAILDLQARISAEQNMLANEQTKLDVLYQTARAEELARDQRARELAVAGVGSLRTLPAMGL